MLTIKPLTREFYADYIEFFENRAFTDNAEWAGCYCMHHHRDKAINQQIDQLEIELNSRQQALKTTAHQLLDKDILQGFLAFEDDRVVGFCNANDKRNYHTLNCADSEKVFAIVCITIDPRHRGKGIATALVSQILNFARTNNYTHIESHTEPRQLFINLGFSQYEDIMIYETN